MITPWTNLDPDTSIVFWAYNRIYDNERNGCFYHNSEHVRSMYQYLADTNEPYDECLDWAVLFHDIVYDNLPQKEYRSAVMFSDMKARYKGCELSLLDEGHVAALILATENHRVTYPGHSAIIRADLHGLTDPVKTMRNFVNIMDESCQLYKITPSNFAKNSESFMESLSGRVQRNISSDPLHAEFYHKVIQGIELTKELARVVQKGAFE